MAAPQPIPFEGLDEHQRAALRAKRDMDIQLLKPVTDEQIFLTKTVRALETARQAGEDVLLQLAQLSVADAAVPEIQAAAQRQAQDKRRQSIDERAARVLASRLLLQNGQS